jgi:hypothetical protein
MIRSSAGLLRQSNQRSTLFNEQLVGACSGTTKTWRIGLIRQCVTRGFQRLWRRSRPQRHPFESVGGARHRDGKVSDLRKCQGESERANEQTSKQRAISGTYPRVPSILGDEVTKDDTASRRGVETGSAQQILFSCNTDPSHLWTCPWTCDLCAPRKCGMEGRSGRDWRADRIEKMRAFILCSKSAGSEEAGAYAAPWSRSCGVTDVCTPSMAFLTLQPLRAAAARRQEIPLPIIDDCRMFSLA